MIFARLTFVHSLALCMTALTVACDASTAPDVADFEIGHTFKLTSPASADEVILSIPYSAECTLRGAVEIESDPRKRLLRLDLFAAKKFTETSLGVFPRGGSFLITIF